MHLYIKPTPFLTSPNFPRVKPRSSGSCVCDDEFPIVKLNCALSAATAFRLSTVDCVCWLSYFLPSFLPGFFVPCRLLSFPPWRAHLFTELKKLCVLARGLQTHAWPLFFEISSTLFTCVVVVIVVVAWVCEIFFVLLLLIKMLRSHLRITNCCTFLYFYLKNYMWMCVSVFLLPLLLLLLLTMFFCN